MLRCCVESCREKTTVEDGQLFFFCSKCRIMQCARCRVRAGPGTSHPEDCVEHQARKEEEDAALSEERAVQQALGNIRLRTCPCCKRRFEDAEEDLVWGVCPLKGCGGLFCVCGGTLARRKDSRGAHGSPCRFDDLECPECESIHSLTRVVKGIKCPGGPDCQILTPRQRNKANEVLGAQRAMLETQAEHRQAYLQQHPPQYQHQYQARQQYQPQQQYPQQYQPQGRAHSGTSAAQYPPDPHARSR
mmetsp:Transcript_35886/g.84328  ORF Transcript_35886/g.84328 Transcript_35886/m.84328 type:complete len:246 (+) Transcript_35886:3-740(+)